MNARLIAGLLLSGIALAGNADEPTGPNPAVAALNYGTAGPVSTDSNTQDTKEFQFGTNVTEAVMSDINARMADDLEARMTRALDGQQVPAKSQREALLVSSH